MCSSYKRLISYGTATLLTQSMFCNSQSSLPDKFKNLHSYNHGFIPSSEFYHPMYS